MGAFFQFPSEALIAAITSKQASEENVSFLFVSSWMCTSFDKLLTAAFSPHMLVIRRAFLQQWLSLLSCTCKEISHVHQASASLRRMECVCVPCVQDCKHDSPQGSDQISAAGWRGGGEWFFILAKEQQSQQSLSFACNGRLKCMGSLYFVEHFYGWMQARSLHGWLPEYCIPVKNDLLEHRASASLLNPHRLPQLL